MAIHKYFSYLNKRPFNKYPRYRPNFKHPKTGYYALEMIPLDLVLRNFNQYTKFILVRHPLQRMVAAYHELRKINYTNTDNITHFVSMLISTKDNNKHWLDYQRFCHPCQIRYDYVMKLEAIDSDILELNSLVGANPNATFPKVHANRIIPSGGSYKYDEILRDLEDQHPVLFRQVLDKYSADMEMFGYTWHHGRSGCRYRTGSSNCC